MDDYVLYWGEKASCSHSSAYFQGLINVFLSISTQLKSVP